MWATSCLTPQALQIHRGSLPLSTVSKKNVGTVRSTQRSHVVINGVCVCAIHDPLSLEMPNVSKYIQLRQSLHRTFQFDAAAEPSSATFQPGDIF